MNDIPVKVIKGNKDVVAFFIHHNFNNSLSSSTFPTPLKYADVKPVFKKDDKTNKENYRPITWPPATRGPGGHASPPHTFLLINDFFS